MDNSLVHLKEPRQNHSYSQILGRFEFNHGHKGIRLEGFRRLRELALERYCERVLTEVLQLVAQGGTAHERYLKLWKVLPERDDTIANAFNDVRRSRAIIQILHIVNEDLLTQDELGQFSADLRNRIGAIRKLDL